MPDSMRKRPPTFQHFPANRARVLKKQWVEKTKIKSKWKAQKKKEDLLSLSRLELPTYSGDEAVSNDGDVGDSDGAKEEAQVTPRPTHEHPPHLHPSRSHIHPDLPVKKTKQKPERTERPEPEGRPAKKRKMWKEKEEAELAPRPSVRELMREAYSRSTLHTYKSDPLKRRRSGTQRDGHGAQRQPQKGKGQPNMKLRMNAMLAKIKQDYAS